ncbi:hypothetical protein GCM10023094_49940 [Rhodococcus olei]|uniref:Rieske domain-containing protein n=1 Tax=Rhodococcus olei TaxID=2161675 RepID=A0ABP8PLY6_9NOCA
MVYWHCLGPAGDYRDGKPHAVRAFDTDLVAFADRAGSIRMLDARCPHMGGDLTHGTVVGDVIDCPIHHWCWDGTGASVSGAPVSTPARAWATDERDGLLYVGRAEASEAERSGTVGARA